MPLRYVFDEHLRGPLWHAIQWHNTSGVYPLDVVRVGHMQQLPTSDEINVYASLDEESALEHFLGKTTEQAEALFREHSPCYFEDLMWMGPKAFCFYIPAAINYIRSGASTGDSDAVSFFQAVLKFRLSDERDDLSASLPDLRAGVRFILDNWARFDIDPDTYENLREKYVDLSRQLDAEPPHGL